MASAIAAIVVAALPAGTTLGTATLVGEVAYGATIAGLVVGGGLAVAELFRQPKTPPGTQPIRTEIPPRVSGYGRYKLSGADMLFEAPSASALRVLAVHDGEIDGWERFFYHDDEVAVDNSATGPGVVGGFVNPGPTSPAGDKYYQRDHGPNGRFQATLGQTPGPGFPDLVDYCNLYAPGLWTTNHRGDGIACFYVAAAAVSDQHQLAVWPNGVPNPSASGRLLKVYDPRLNGTLSMGPLAGGASSYFPAPSPVWQWSSNPVCALIHFLCVHPAGPQIAFSRIQPNIADWMAAADVCDQPVTRVYGAAHITSQPWVTGAVTSSPGDNFAALAHGADGIAQGWIGTLTAGQVIAFASENIAVSSLGAGVGSPPGVHGWRVNFASHFAYDHATNEVVTWQPAFGTLTEPRYSIGGSFSWDQDPIEVLKQILDCMDGWLATKGDGTLTVVAGEYIAPSVTLCDPYILDYEVQHFTPDEQAVNELKCTFTDPDRKFNETDAGTWQDTADIAARGVVRSQSLKMPFSPSASQVRRIAKARMVRNSAEIRGWVRTNLYGMNALGQRFIGIQISENAALHSIVAEVTRVTIDLKTLSLTFEFVQVPSDGSLYDWDPSSDEQPPFVAAANGRAQLFTGLSQPAVSASTVNAVQATGTGVGSQLQLTVSNPPADLAGTVTWLVRTAPTGSGNWSETALGTGSITVGTATTTLNTGFVPSGNVDVQVAYETAGGVSPWSNTTTVNAAQPAAAVPVTMTASEAITAPALVNVWSSSGGKIRHADASLNQPADGFILGNVSMGGNVTVYFDGEVTGLSGLTPGDAWAGDTGAVTTTPPGSSVMSQLVGEAVGTATIVFAPKPPVFP